MIPHVRIWIPLSWRRTDYINTKGRMIRRSVRAIAVTAHKGKMLGNYELVIRATLVLPRKAVVTCICGHPLSAHQHYRRGSDCSLCRDCRKYQPAEVA